MDKHDPSDLCDEINKIMKHYPHYENYVKISSTPLSTIATSNSALTITSLLLFMNSSMEIVKLLAGINLIILLITTSLSIFFLIILYRANFRLSRVHYRVKIKNYHERRDYDNEELKDLVFLTHLAKSGQNTINRMEELYHNVLWRYFFIFVVISFVLMLIAVLEQFYS